MKKLIVFITAITFTAYLNAQTINKEGKSIVERFTLPDGYERIYTEENSFAEYLRNHPLKKFGTPVLLYNGKKK